MFRERRQLYWQAGGQHGAARQADDRPAHELLGEAWRVRAGSAPRARIGIASLDVLGRIVGLSRSNILFSPALGEGISEVELLPQSRLSGETVYATLELVGYKDPFTGEIRIPRRPLTPGTKVYGVDYALPHELLRVLRGHEHPPRKPGRLREGREHRPGIPRREHPRHRAPRGACHDRLGEELHGRADHRAARLAAQRVRRRVRPARRIRQGLSRRQAQLQRPARQGRGSSGPAEARRDPDARSSSCRTAEAASRSTRRSSEASTRSTPGRTSASPSSSTTSTLTSSQASFRV